LHMQLISHSVGRTVFEDMGKFPEDIWASFEPTPIASASLAQVRNAIPWNDAVHIAIFTSYNQWHVSVI
jgi:predicted unusual protein kinase regulating ubiquinone biosynthesis (AarF/ABC1/UbiB family)